LDFFSRAGEMSLVTPESELYPYAALRSRCFFSDSAGKTSGAIGGSFGAPLCFGVHLSSPLLVCALTSLQQPYRSLSLSLLHGWILMRAWNTPQQRAIES
jgi:hypothetical protein